jgi:hypothetical protein
MLPSSLCRLWQPDRAGNAAQDNRSYTTTWGTIDEDRYEAQQTRLMRGARKKREAAKMRLDA